MRYTKQANAWLKTFHNLGMSWGGLWPIMSEAGRIARERNSRVIGKIHLEQALEQALEKQSDERSE